MTELEPGADGGRGRHRARLRLSARHRRRRRPGRRLLRGSVGRRRGCPRTSTARCRCGSPRAWCGPVDPGDVPAKELRRLDRVILLALAAAREALADAGLVAGEGCDRRPGRASRSARHRRHRDAARATTARLLEGGPRRVSPFFIPMTLANMPAGMVAIHHGLRGPNLCHVTACASRARTRSASRCACSSAATPT